MSKLLLIVSHRRIAKVFVLISDSNGTTVEKKGNKEIYSENTGLDNDALIEEDDIVNLDPTEMLMNTVAESLVDAVKTEL